MAGAGLNFLFNIFNGFVITYPSIAKGWKWMNRRAGGGGAACEGPGWGLWLCVLEITGGVWSLYAFEPVPSQLSNQKRMTLT